MAQSNLTAAGSRRIVYFPLQVEPEGSLTGYAPHATDQIGLIRACSLNLPADALLVVKEHPWQMGRRGTEFYRAIADLPNVLLVHPGFPSLEIIKHASLVCSIASSAAHEAAVLGVPVALFHDGAPIGCLEHVHIMRSARDFERLPTLMSEGGKEQIEKRNRDGARYLLAIEQYCFELGKEGQAIFLREEEPTAEELERMATALSLALPMDFGEFDINTDKDLQKTKA
jgi:hypothetical protein